MTPMKSLQEWAADCVAESLLHSLCVTQLAFSAFRCQVDSSHRETINQCLTNLKMHLSSLECTAASSNISNPISRLLKQRIASVAEYISCQSQINFLKASILKLLLLEEFVLSTGVVWGGRDTVAREDIDGDFNIEYSSSDAAYLDAFIWVLETLGPFPVEKAVICFDFQDTDNMKSVLQALFKSCTKIRSIHLAGKSVHLIALSKLKFVSKQLEELVLIDSFGSLTKDVFCVSLLGRPWIEYISSHDGRYNCLEPQFPVLKHLWYQRQNSHQGWNDSFIKTAILAYYPNLRTLNWHANDRNHNYALTKIPGLSGKQYDLENLLLTSVDLSHSNKNEASNRLICSVDVEYLSQVFPGLLDVSLVFSRGGDCQCSRSELRGPCKNKASQIIETLTNMLSECKKVESLTAGGDILHLGSILYPVLSIYGHRLRSLGLQLFSTATTKQEDIISIVSLCLNLENITITGNSTLEGQFVRSCPGCKWPRVRTLQFMLSVTHPENIELMQMFISASRFVESLSLSTFTLRSLCSVLCRQTTIPVTTLILPMLDDISDCDLDQQLCAVLRYCPRVRHLYVPRRLRGWRLLQEKLWNRGVTIRFTDLLVGGS